MAPIRFAELDGREIEPSWRSVRDALERVGQRRAREFLMDAERNAGNIVFLAMAVEPSGIVVSARGRGDVSNFDMVDPSGGAEIVECRLPTGQTELTTTGGLLRIEQVVAAAEYFFTSLERTPTAIWREPFSLEERIASGEAVRRLRKEPQGG